MRLKVDWLLVLWLAIELFLLLAVLLAFWSTGGRFLLLGQVPPGREEKVGSAAFRIGPNGGDILMQPMVAPLFKLELLKGPKPDKDDIQLCGIWKKEVVRDEAQVIVLTLLRCGETTYAVAEVDFSFEEAKPKKEK